MVIQVLFKLVVGAGALLALALSGWVGVSLTALPPAATPAPLTAIAQLTHDKSNALRPSWSPDHQSIVFESNRESLYHIYVMDASGDHQRALTSGPNEDRHPVWTADGRSIIYESFDGTDQEIWSVRVADGSRRQLTKVDGLAEQAAPSPDAQWVAFYVYKDMKLNLWLSRADGSDARPLTHDLANAQRNEPTVAWHHAAWSPDSRTLAYTGGDGRSIWLMNRDGSNARKVFADYETNHAPWFLSDGRLAYITEYVPPRFDGAWTNAWTIDVQTGKRTLLIEHMSMQGPVDFSSDLKRVLFHSPRNGRFDIYLVDLNAAGGLAALQGTDGEIVSGGY